MDMEQSSPKPPLIVKKIFAASTELAVTINIHLIIPVTGELIDYYIALSLRV
jgi:hypothetical protein